MGVVLWAILHLYLFIHEVWAESLVPDVHHRRVLRIDEGLEVEVTTGEVSDLLVLRVFLSRLLVVLIQEGKALDESVGRPLVEPQLEVGVSWQQVHQGSDTSLQVG